MVSLEVRDGKVKASLSLEKGRSYDAYAMTVEVAVGVAELFIQFRKCLSEQGLPPEEIEGFCDEARDLAESFEGDMLSDDSDDFPHDGTSLLELISAEIEEYYSQD